MEFLIDLASGLKKASIKKLVPKGSVANLFGETYKSKHLAEF